MTDILQLPRPTWFAGCGNMGGAIIDGWRAAGLDLGGVTVIRPSGKPVEGTRTISSFADAGAPPKLLVIGFKAHKIAEIARELRRYLSAGTVVVSLLAGVEADSLRDRFPGAAAIVRATPNLPVAVRRGVTGLYSADASDAVRDEVGNIFSALGFAMWMVDEARLGALGAVAGAGPAYVARFIAALTNAGEKRGLSAEIAEVIARETVLGTAWMGATMNEGTESIARRVASPNGTTEAGLAVLDREQALDRLVAETIEAAARRGAELALEARAPLAESTRLH
jgi:pyrroline-5-carboxylate reductase